MKTITTYIGYFLIIAGIIFMAGAGGDCDGKCGSGNSIGDVLFYAGMGLTMFLTGALIALKNN